MSILTMLFVASALLLTGLALLAVRQAAPTRQKLLGLVLVLGLMPVAYLALAELMSRSKPVALEWWQARVESATVLAGHMEEGEAIHLWLMLEEEIEPRAFRLAWSSGLAEELHEAMQQAEENGTAVEMRLPFEGSLDLEEPRFHALPQPSLPEKDMQKAGPMIFARPGQEA